MDYDFSEGFELIAERTLINRSTTPHTEIYVRIGKPIQMPMTEWGCPYQIVGLGDEQVRAIFGIDAVQSLQLVMGIVGSILENEQKTQRLTFSDDEDLGFPKSAHRDEFEK